MTPEEAREFLIIPLKQMGLTVEIGEIEGEDLMIIRNHDGDVVGSIPLYGNPPDDKIE